MKNRKKLIVLFYFLLLFLGTVFSQNEMPEILIINYADSIDFDLDPSTVIKEIRIKRTPLNKPYEKLVKQAIDSTKTFNGNCLKVDFYDDGKVILMEENWKWPPYIKASIYDLEPNKRDTVYHILKKNQAKRDSIFKNRTGWEKFFNVDPIKKADEKRTRKEETKEFFRSIETDSIKKGFFEAGVSCGLDYIIFMNLNVLADIYLLNKKSNKISINNKAGILLGIVDAGIAYEYPSLKYHRRISKHWITVSFGREYSVALKREGVKEKFTVDYRMDIGLKMYKKKNAAVEIYFPIRIDDEIPAYFTGPSLNWTYIF